MTSVAGSRTLLPWFVILALLAVDAVALHLGGRWLICACGRVDLWAGAGAPDGSSQHLLDWYSPSHLLHGILFYAVLVWVLPRLGIVWRLMLAVAVEVGWELIENSSYVIARYRQVTVSKDYNGDTIVNSLADVVVMMAGFALARVLPAWVSAALVAGFELLTLWVIRDGLTLNVLMLLWPVPAIADWQAGM